LPVAGIAARKSLPGEIVFGHGKIAGEPFEAAAQDLRHALVARQRIELRRGMPSPNSEAGWSVSQRTKRLSKTGASSASNTARWASSVGAARMRARSIR
jgi:hypothetical protein